MRRKQSFRTPRASHTSCRACGERGYFSCSLAIGKDASRSASSPCNPTIIRIEAAREGCCGGSCSSFRTRSSGTSSCDRVSELHAGRR